MLPQIEESDWKIVQALKPLALERFCERVLSDIQRAAADPQMTA